MNNHMEPFSSLKKLTLFAASFVIAYTPMQGFSQTPLLRPGITSVSIPDVAKKATAPVVSISVKSPVQGRAPISFRGREYHFEEPFDFFNDRFIEEFFGAPRREKAPQQRFQTSQGSGFIVSPDGYLLTNAHVVQNAEEIQVVFNDGQEFEGKVVGADPNTDVAVVKINAKDLPFLTLGNSDDLEVGQWVVAIGNPLGLQASVTAGIVSAKGRNNLSLMRIEDFIQTDAAINRGNSGGPLLNLNSEVVGMNTALVTNMGSGGYMGIGFAIPSNILQRIMEELIETGTVTRGFMGVSLQEVNRDLAQAFGIDRAEGALVSDVSKDSPAEKAGIKQGDIILEYNSKKVGNIVSLRNAISLMKPGSRISLTILRDGRTRIVPMTVGTYPSEEGAASGIKETQWGIEVEALTPDLAKSLGYTGLHGVVISQVKSGSPAAFAGLRKGTLIVAVNHREIHSTDEFLQEVKNTDSNKPLLLLVKQGEHMHFVSIKMG